MVLWEWVEGQDVPDPDFGVKRMCVDHGKFRKWMDKKDVDRDIMRGWNEKWDGGRSRNGGLGGKTRVKVVPPEVKDGGEMGKDSPHDHHAHGGIS
jgi:hypothetical protein